MTYMTIGTLRVNRGLYDFLADEALPHTGVTPDAFWGGVGRIVNAIGPHVREKLARRAQLQSQIDVFMAREHECTPARHEEFLREIGYLVDEPRPFVIATDNVDTELTQQPGPQLVVPITNARYVLNAVNARWGSVYDALYGTDAIARECALQPGQTYNAVRGQVVIRRVRAFLDEIAPLMTGSHADVVSYYIQHGELHAKLECGRTTGLCQPGQFVGFSGEVNALKTLLLRNHHLHVELRFDRHSLIGEQDKAGIADVVLESAVSTIIDAEDSVAAVDAQDKVQVYRNWLHLMQGTLTADVPGAEGVYTRRLAQDRHYCTPDGAPLVLSGRSLMLFRSVGWHMSTDAVLDDEGRAVAESILDVAVAAAIAIHDIKGLGCFRNSMKGSVYIVRPKMHGPEEVALSVDLFSAVEEILGLAAGALKMGLMDEERRTSVNLAACLYAARDRVFFINTGFLDRTGDEIHTTMQAGAVVRKGDMKQACWMAAYEQRNVAIGLACGLRGHAQIGKGMWAMPDRMADMLASKGAQLEAGASTAWVPSPTAATLHALHYHMNDVRHTQLLLSRVAPQPVAELLVLPVEKDVTRWSEAEIAAELDTNLQGILGYVVRWVDMGIGCSKVPDLNGVGLMEDRATLRISSQHIGNWLVHGIVTSRQVEKALHRMAAIVDAQNADAPDYRPLLGDMEGPAYRAAQELVFEGASQPCGYTEEILHRYRRIAKERDCGSRAGVLAA
ncbi:MULTISPECIES: malate synthase G [Acetobacter]|uniref:malate synthase G n=1 Tax=Acetobacter TaxID=434 RepID=UPI00376F5399